MLRGLRRARALPSFRTLLLHRNPADRCPAYNVPEDIDAAVRERQRRDDVEIAGLIDRGIPTVPITTGVHGGMNPAFLAAAK